MLDRAFHLSWFSNCFQLIHLRCITISYFFNDGFPSFILIPTQASFLSPKFCYIFWNSTSILSDIISSCIFSRFFFVSVITVKCLRNILIFCNQRILDYDDMKCQNCTVRYSATVLVSSFTTISINVNFLFYTNTNQ